MVVVSLELVQSEVKDLLEACNNLKKELEMCSETERQEDCFYTRMSAVYQSAMKDISLTNDKLVAAANSFSSLLEYFAEDSAQASDEFFSNILKFSQSFAVSTFDHFSIFSSEVLIWIRF